MMSRDNEGKGFLERLREFLYGFTIYDGVLAALKKKAQIENLFMLVTMGNMLGVPIIPQYYVLRLLPLALPRIPGWKRYMMREKDLTDKADFG